MSNTNPQGSETHWTTKRAITSRAGDSRGFSGSKSATSQGPNACLCIRPARVRWEHYRADIRVVPDDEGALCRSFHETSELFTTSDQQTWAVERGERRCGSGDDPQALLSSEWVWRRVELLAVSQALFLHTTRALPRFGEHATAAQQVARSGRNGQDEGNRPNVAASRPRSQFGARAKSGTADALGGSGAGASAKG
ncbi:hypothetical protein EJ04DRAFT_598256 [Polyplosphaeria fusca]|uniref:Uncharacterized protein n=1 Tax=Polyplosphaeria fusca TaxID=682080 RepID=A0A9P4V5C5_9PLEO|nr:hypothetical protein EJ04DRAFT_598256 [Polyplosphaeria fusca]